MLTRSFCPRLLFALVTPLALVGCNSKPAAPPASVVVEEDEVVEEIQVPPVVAAEKAADATAATSPAAENAMAASTTDDAEIAAAFASLSEADRAAATAQKICPVSDQPLGSMGAPIKVTVAGRDVFICCEHCREPLEKDPAKYLAKLDEKK